MIEGPIVLACNGPGQREDEAPNARDDGEVIHVEHVVEDRLTLEVAREGWKESNLFICASLHRNARLSFLNSS